MLFDGPVVVVGKAVVVKTVVVPCGVVAKFVVVFGSVGAGVAGTAGVNGAAGVGAGTVPILKVGVTVLAPVGEFVGSLEVKKAAAVGRDDGFGVGDDVGAKLTVVVLVIFFPSLTTEVVVEVVEVDVSVVVGFVVVVVVF